jgi:PucR family transcriptional regulator, purine catabolism regulatory protein
VSASTGISIADALRLPGLSGARVVAGGAGLDRVIGSVNVMEVPDIARYVREGELLLTTAYPLRDDAGALAGLVPLLARKRLAGMALKPGRYISGPPPQMLADAERLGFPLIELPGDASFNDILADVLGTILNRQALQLERSSAIHDRLSAVVLQGGSFGELIRTLADLVQGPAAILDARGQVLATSEPGGIVPDRPVGAVRPIQVGSVQHGELVVWADGEAPADTMLAMEQAVTIAALLMAQTRSAAAREQRYRAVLLQELVSGHPVDREDLGEAAAAFGWDLRLSRAALIAELEQRGASGSVLVAGQPLEERLQQAVRTALGDTAIAWGLRTGLAVLVHVEQGPLARAGEALRTEIRRSHPDVEVSVALGRVYDDLADLSRSYREAVQTMALGRDLHSAGFVLAYEELGLYRLLHQLPSGELERYCQEMLGPLLEYDRRHQGSLVRTLECHLRHQGNVAAAARELFIHYNTMRHRLGLIETLTGGLGTRPADRAALEVALHARTLLLARG